MRNSKSFKRLITALLLILSAISGIYIENQTAKKNESPILEANSALIATVKTTGQYVSALDGLSALGIKGRAPKTGYARKLFGDGWARDVTCDTRNRILARDLTNITYEVNSCKVLSGTLIDPYTAQTLPFVRGQDTSDDIQIDHVVALSDAWQKGAQLLTTELRIKLANDGLNLLAVEGAVNQRKGDSDAATWLPPNVAFRCKYVARQVSVKLKYSLWVTVAEKDAMVAVLGSCPGEPYLR